MYGQALGSCLRVRPRLRAAKVALRVTRRRATCGRVRHCAARRKVTRVARPVRGAKVSTNTAMVSTAIVSIAARAARPVPGPNPNPSPSPGPNPNPNPNPSPNPNPNPNQVPAARVAPLLPSPGERCARHRARAAACRALRCGRGVARGGGGERAASRPCCHLPRRRSVTDAPARILETRLLRGSAVPVAG